MARAWHACIEKEGKKQEEIRVRVADIMEQLAQDPELGRDLKKQKEQEQSRDRLANIIEQLAQDPELERTLKKQKELIE